MAVLISEDMGKAMSKILVCLPYPPIFLACPCTAFQLRVPEYVLERGNNWMTIMSFRSVRPNSLLDWTQREPHQSRHWANASLPVETTWCIFVSPAFETLGLPIQRGNIVSNSCLVLPISSTSRLNSDVEHVIWLTDVRKEFRCALS